MKLVDHCKDLRTLSAKGLYQSRVSNSRLSSKLKYTGHGEAELSVLISNMVPVDFATFAGFVNPFTKEPPCLQVCGSDYSKTRNARNNNFLTPEMDKSTSTTNSGKIVLPYP